MHRIFEDFFDDIDIDDTIQSEEANLKNYNNISPIDKLPWVKASSKELESTVDFIYNIIQSKREVDDLNKFRKIYARVLMQRWVNFCNLQNIFSECRLFISHYDYNKKIWAFEINYESVSNEDIINASDNMDDYFEISVRLYLKLKDNVSLEKFKTVVNKINDITPGDITAKYLDRSEYPITNSFMETFDAQNITYLYQDLTGKYSQPHFHCQSNMIYSGPVKMSYKSNKQASEMNIGDLLYSTPSGELVSEPNPENTPIACKFTDDNLFVSLNVLSPVHIRNGMPFAAINSSDTTAYVFYGCDNVCFYNDFSKKYILGKMPSAVDLSKTKSSHEYQYILSRINFNNAEINWNSGKITLQNANHVPGAASTKEERKTFYQNLFTLTYRFSPLGTKKGDWFLGNDEIYGKLLDAFEHKLLPDIFQPLYALKLFCSTDKTNKTNKVLQSLPINKHNYIQSKKTDCYLLTVAMPILHVQ